MKRLAPVIGLVLSLAIIGITIQEFRTCSGLGFAEYLVEGVVLEVDASSVTYKFESQGKTYQNTTYLAGYPATLTPGDTLSISFFPDQPSLSAVQGFVDTRKVKGLGLGSILCLLLTFVAFRNQKTEN